MSSGNDYYNPKSTMTNTKVSPTSGKKIIAFYRISCSRNAKIIGATYICRAYKDKNLY